MKLLFILIIFFTANIFLAQEQDTISQDVISFWNIVNENAKFVEKKVSIKKQYTNEELKDIATKLYIATEKDPFGFQRYIIKAFKKYKENGKTYNSLIAPSPKLHMLITDINKVYGENYGEIIETPFFIRGKIIKKIDTFYYAENNKFPQAKLLVKIEETIKGKKYLKPDSIIEINYLYWWLDHPIRIDVSTSYFMALRVWGDKGNKLCLNNYSRGELEIYPVKNNIIEIRNNIFGFGKNVEWNKFISFFKSKYILDHSLM